METKILTGKYSWLERCMYEDMELNNRIDKFDAYLSDRRSVDENSQEAIDYMLAQIKAMRAYRDALEKRIEIGMREVIRDRVYWQDRNFEIMDKNS